MEIRALYLAAAAILHLFQLSAKQFFRLLGKAFATSTEVWYNLQKQFELDSFDDSEFEDLTISLLKAQPDLSQATQLV